MVDHYVLFVFVLLHISQGSAGHVVYGLPLMLLLLLIFICICIQWRSTCWWTRSLSQGDLPLFVSVSHLSLLNPHSSPCFFLPRRCLTKTIQGKILLIPSIWCLSILVFAFQPRTNLFLLFFVMQLCPVLPPLLQGSLSCHMPVLGWSWVTS
jgi:hypothetical protein